MATTDQISVRVYHQCPSHACGSTLGPFAVVSYWWAMPTGAGWAIRLLSDAQPEEQGWIRGDIADTIGLSLPELVRRLQDDRAEAPQL